MIYIPTEAQEQEMFCKWLDIKRIEYFAISNENIWSGIVRSLVKDKKLAKQIIVLIEKKMKQLGKKKGIADMFIFAPNKALFMEMKRRDPKLSRTSKEQAAFIDKANKYPYAEARVCYGYDEAVAFVMEHL